MWVEFVVGPLPCSERDFPGTPDFSPLLKNEHFQVPVRSGTAWKARTRLSSTAKCSVGKQTKNMTNLIAIDETTIFKDLRNDRIGWQGWFTYLTMYFYFLIMNFCCHRLGGSSSLVVLPQMIYYSVNDSTSTFFFVETEHLY